MLFRSKVTDEGSGRIESTELGCTLVVDRKLSGGRGATVWAAVRPEKITMSRKLGEGHPPRENVVTGVVKEIAYMGDMSIYLVQIDSGRTLRVTLPNIMRDAEHRIARDESVYLSWHGSSPVVLTE